MDFTSAEQSLWFTQPEEEAAKNVMNLAEAAEQENAPRVSRAAYNASFLEGVGLQGFGAWAYGKRSTGPVLIGDGPSKCPLTWNYAAAGLDTLQAKIVGKDEPKPMIQVTDGDWDDARKAVWSTRFLNGMYRQQQGSFHDLWDLGRTAFKIAAGVTGSVAVKVVAYPEENRIYAEMHDTLDMWIDHFECTYSNPLTYGETTWFDALRLMEAFPDHKQQIWDAREPLPLERGGDEGSKTRYMVRLVEGWRLKLGKKPGKYIAAIRNCCLRFEDYDYNTPPFAFLHARRSMAGFYGIPVMERGMRIVERINQILFSLDKAERLLPKNMLIYDIQATPVELMKNIHDVMQIGYNSALTGAQAPSYITPQLYDQTCVNLLEMHIRAFHETLGINSNEMSATKPSGVIANVAIRTVADLFTELFSVISRDYTKFITQGIGELYLRAIDQLREANGDFTTTWDGGGFMKELKSSVVDLKDKSFTFQIYPVSETSNTPADRISLADEMLSRKELSPEAYQRVIETGDLPRETKRQKTQYTMIARAMDSWMHDEFEEISNISPLPWMNLAEAITQVLDGYMEILMIPNFDQRRELYFRRYITQCDQIMKRQALEKAQLSGVASGSEQMASALGQQQQPEPIAAE